MKVKKNKEQKKPMKMEQKNICRPEWECQVKQTHPFLASPICIGQAHWGGDKKYKKRKPRWIEASPLGSAHPHALRVYLPLLVNKTLSCTGAVTLVRHFFFFFFLERKSFYSNQFTNNNIRKARLRGHNRLFCPIPNSIPSQWTSI